MNAIQLCIAVTLSISPLTTERIEPMSITTPTLGQIVLLPIPNDTDNAPTRGRIVELEVGEAGSNVVAYSPSMGGDVGDAEDVRLLTIPPVAMPRLYEAPANYSYPPGTIGRLFLTTPAPVFGDPAVPYAVFVYVLQAFNVIIPTGDTNPFTGSAVAVDTTVPVIYGQICEVCQGEIRLSKTGERITFSPPTVPTAGVWEPSNPFSRGVGFTTDSV
jgi:hypothetical protein